MAIGGGRSLDASGQSLAWQPCKAQLRLFDFGADVKRPHQMAKPGIAKAKAEPVLVFKIERRDRLPRCQCFAEFRKRRQELRFCTIIGPLAS